MAKAKKPKQVDNIDGNIAENLPVDNTQDSVKLIYIGPNITRIGLSQFQVFLGGMPVAALKAADTLPEIQRLFVPIGDFAKAKLALNRDGSLEQKTYKAVVAAFST